MTYSKFTHTHVMINHPTMPGAKRSGEQMPDGPKWSDEGWAGPHEIMLHTGAHVWVAGCYSMQGHPEVLQVGIGGAPSTAYDEDGNCILAVPAAWCKFYSPEEAEGIAQCMDADERLLSYAR